jgi:hypothetical protein
VDVGDEVGWNSIGRVENVSQSHHQRENHPNDASTSTTKVHHVNDVVLSATYPVGGYRVNCVAMTMLGVGEGEMFENGVSDTIRTRHPLQEKGAMVKWKSPPFS